MWEQNVMVSSGWHYVHILNSFPQFENSHNLHHIQLKPSMNIEALTESTAIDALSVGPRRFFPLS